MKATVLAQLGGSPPKAKSKAGAESATPVKAKSPMAVKTLAGPESSATVALAKAPSVTPDEVDQALQELGRPRHPPLKQKKEPPQAGGAPTPTAADAAASAAEGDEEAAEKPTPGSADSGAGPVDGDWPDRTSVELGSMYRALKKQIPLLSADAQEPRREILKRFKHVENKNGIDRNNGWGRACIFLAYFP